MKKMKKCQVPWGGGFFDSHCRLTRVFVCLRRKTAGRMLTATFIVADYETFWCRLTKLRSRRCWQNTKGGGRRPSGSTTWPTWAAQSLCPLHSLCMRWTLNRCHTSALPTMSASRTTVFWRTFRTGRLALHYFMCICVIKCYFLYVYCKVAACLSNAPFTGTYDNMAKMCLAHLSHHNSQLQFSAGKLRYLKNDFLCIC